MPNSTLLGSSGEQKDPSAESRKRAETEEAGGVDPGNLEVGPPHVPDHAPSQGQEFDATRKPILVLIVPV